MVMQDWSYEIAEAKDIERYIKHYDILNNEDKKFVLMETIIQAVTDQPDDESLKKYWTEAKIDYLLIDKFTSSSGFKPKRGY